MDQLCWKCSKATDDNQCSWVKHYVYPKGVELDKDNYIISCPCFKKDKIVIEKWGVQASTILQFFGIGRTTYRRYKSRYKDLYVKYQDLENAPTITELAEYFHIPKRGLTKNYEKLLEKYLTNNGKSL